MYRIVTHLLCQIAFSLHSTFIIPDGIIQLHIVLKYQRYAIIRLDQACLLFRSVIARSQLVARSLRSLLHTRSSTSLPPLCDRTQQQHSLARRRGAHTAARRAHGGSSLLQFLVFPPRQGAAFSVRSSAPRAASEGNRLCGGAVASPLPTRSAMYIVCVQ